MDALSPGDVLVEVPEVEVQETTTTLVHVEFWNLYEEFGISTATNYFEMETVGDVEYANEVVKQILAEAKSRGIDMVAFLQEWDAFQKGENKDGDRAGSESGS